MFRNFDDYKKYGLTTVNCLLTDGGMGDLLCSLMAINHIINSCPWINLLIWVPDYMKDFCKHVLPEGSCIRDYTEAKKKYDPNKPGITTRSNNQHSPMRVHPAKFAYHIMCDMEPNLEQLSYLKINSSKIDINKFQLPEKYVIIQGAYTETVKTMPSETFNKLTDYVLSKGYIPVYLGKTENKSGLDNIKITAKIKDDYDLSKGINLLNKTNLLESASIIEKAKIFIGMDGGLSHLAAFTDVPIICGYTFASHEQLMPIRNGIQGLNVYPVIPDDSLGCRFCQTNLTLFYNHDMRNCLYPDDNPFLCTKQMTFDKFYDIIEQKGLL